MLKKNFKNHKNLHWFLTICSRRLGRQRPRYTTIKTREIVDSSKYRGKSFGSLKITKIQHVFRPFASFWSSKSCPESWFFGKSSMGTLQKSQKCHEKMICLRQLLKNRDFHVLNGFDHTLEAIGGRNWKIVIFDAKIVRIAQNQRTEQLFWLFTSCWSYNSCSESWFFGKSSMGTLQKSRSLFEIRRIK